MIIFLGERVDKWKCIYENCHAKCCAGGRELTISDLKKISKETGKEINSFAEFPSIKIPEKTKPSMFRLKNVDGNCIFLREDYGCRLHESGSKPILCEIYPFFIDSITYGDQIFMKIRPVSECPGYEKGDTLNKHLIEEKGMEYLSEIRKLLKYAKQGLSWEEILQKEGIS